MTLLVHRATFLLRDAHRIERNADLLIEGNRVAAVGRDLPVPPGVETIDAQSCAVIPGLVNAHTHLYQNFLKGVGAGLALKIDLENQLVTALSAQEGGRQPPALHWVGC